MVFHASQAFVSHDHVQITLGIIRDNTRSNTKKNIGSTMEQSDWLVLVFGLLTTSVV